MTASERRALDILYRRGPLTPGFFASAMWPDSEGWERFVKCGPYGVHKGGAMPRTGGAYLGRLSKKGWVRVRFTPLHHQSEYAITSDGRRALTEV